MTKDIFAYSMLFKACVPALMLFGSSARSAGQWSIGSGGALYYEGGNARIGTTSPSGWLHGYKHWRTLDLSESISLGAECALFKSSNSCLFCASTQSSVPFIVLFSGRPSGESIPGSSEKGTK